MKHKNRSHRTGGLFRSKFINSSGEVLLEEREKKKEGCKVSLKLAELFLFLGEVKSRGEGYVVVDNDRPWKRESKFEFESRTTVYNYH